MNDSLSHLVERARAADPEWSRARHEEVRAAVDRRFAARERRKRALVVARSSIVGVALFALAMRAFGGSPVEAPSAIESSSSSSSSGAGPQVAYDDGGFHADVVRD